MRWRKLFLCSPIAGLAVLSGDARATAGVPATLSPDAARDMGADVLADAGGIFIPCKFGVAAPDNGRTLGNGKPESG